MKKLFFPKSSSSHGAEGGEQRQKSPATRDKKQSSQMRWKTMGSGNLENKVRNSEHSIPICEGKVTEKKTISQTRSNLVLRRSRSFQMSSAADNSGRFSEQDLTGLRDWKNIPPRHRRRDISDCDYQFNKGDSKPKGFNVATVKMSRAEVLQDHACSCPSDSSSPQSSFVSTSIPGKVLDLYIDGEQHQEMKLGTSDYYPRSSKESNLFFLSRNYSLKSENQPESPRKIAKDVVERLLRIEQLCDPKSHGDTCPNWVEMPTTVCDKQSDRQCYDPTRVDILDKHLDGQSSTLLSEEKEDQAALALQRKLEEVKERTRLLSEQLAEGRSFQYYSDENVRNLVEEKRSLVLEIYDQLQCRIAEKVAAKEAVSLLKGEMNSTIVKLERDKDDVKSRLQKELDRRSDEWEDKLKQFQSEEHRLRDRVMELAEKNVSLQREKSGFHNKEKEYTDRISHMQIHLKNIIAETDEARSENDSLREQLSEIHYKLKVSEEVQSSMERNYKEKDRDYIELTKVVARLRGTCTEQERAVDGLRQCLNSENPTNKLQMEQLRLTGVEQDLRRQLETCIVETNSLRSENIYLLERLKNMGKVGGSSALKLEHELVSYVQCLQNMGLSLLNECIPMCDNLLGVLERKTDSEGFMESHSLVQHGIKVQRFRKDLEQLTRSLGKTAAVLKEKANIASSEPELPDTSNREALEDDLKSELEAERLLTKILKEKLYFKEKEVEQMQVELARALRSHDVLQREIQDTSDTVSCVNHKMKNLELQMIKKDGTINQIQGDIRSYDEELTTIRGTLSKVSQERDFMWQEVKGYSEKNMLLNHEVESLKKKIECLEEDTLLKDGQISILKDTLNNTKPFNILFETEHVNKF
ncbi:uncharacterized protein [Spinacia oleracea]|uniref:DUF7653 domain-containing protein n=1 Tax=Spinacia oleracea TaxID=3562 RepID=A0A9R0HWL3_SPIOL|nr:uncharacterized protein LOC110777869 [Spinacia oleracea]XP_021838146.2 uncharacterized protein LOC110777869 [Spinacia oleracea]